MEKKSLVILLLILGLYFPTLIFAETIVLKSGKTVEDKIDEVENISSQSKEPPSNTKNLKSPQEYSFKTAIITYKLSGFQNGEEIVYIDGNKVAKDTNVTGTFAGRTVAAKRGFIFDGENAFNVEPKYQQAVKIDLSQLKGEAKNAGIFPDEESLKNYYAGNEKFLDKDCRVYDTGIGKAYFYQGILLKQETKDIFFGRVRAIARGN